jgi:glutamine cyclotransferase
MKNILIFLFFLIIISCKTDDETNKSKNLYKTELKSKKGVDYFKIEKPINLDTVTYGSFVDFKIVLIDTLQATDSFHVFLNGVLIHTDLKRDFSIEVAPEKVGENILSINTFLKTGLTQRKSINLFLLSDIEPKKIKYNVIKTYPHSTENFTQGLVYKDGLLYEGTGDWGKSAIFVSDLKTGKVLKSIYLPSDKFGEGIAILNNRITQLTYKSMEGYIYDQHSFSQIRKFNYSFFTEGWGLTTDEKDFIMSNGTEKIYVLDSTYYSPIVVITVCDDKEPIDSLNGLEYVHGLIYSNIWMSNKIAQIDYKTGKVLGYLDLTAIIPQKYRNHPSDVLNGIAYNDDNKSFLITGKHWDQIYEIKIED